jgi:hypothetical protein
MLHVSIIVYGTFLRNIIHDTSPASKWMAHHVKILLLHVTAQGSLWISQFHVFYTWKWKTN